VNNIAVVLALIAVVVLAVHYWRGALAVLLLGFAAFITYQRLRELRS